MSHDQDIFGSMFGDVEYPIPTDPPPRKWQTEALVQFMKGPRLAEYGQKRFTIYAGVGSGKTIGAALIAAYLLNAKQIDQIIFVCPNRSILHRVIAVFRKRFGIELEAYNKAKHAGGLARMRQGYVVTYQSVNNDPTQHRKLCNFKGTRTLVIFDEVHHLGDNNGAWGRSAVEAFGLASQILNLTGTPYRSDGSEIPFVEYEDGDRDGFRRFKADYTYSIGRAIADGVCREPVFRFADAEVIVRSDPDSEGFKIDQDSLTSDRLESLWLAGAVKHGSEPRRRLLAAALAQCKEAGRKVIIFLGGDTSDGQCAKGDAKKLLPAELKALGYSEADYEVVVGDDRTSQRKIAEFGESDKWILISIDMVSEGTDIPEISAAIFLTLVTAKQKSIQRFGRALRLRGESDPHQLAWIYLFRSPTLMGLAEEINREVEEFKPKTRREPTGTGEEAEKFRRPECIGVGDAPINTFVCSGKKFTRDQVDQVIGRCREQGFSPSIQQAILVLLMEGENAA